MAPPPLSPDAPTASPEGDKATLRRELRARRRRLALAREAASRALADRLDTLPVDDWAGRTVSLYLADATEIDPAPLARRLVERGARIALPVVTARDLPLAFRLAVPDDRLVPDAAGIPAPPSDSPAVRPDVVLAPLLGFDAQGGRIGQGGGYYDRTLAVLRAEGPVIVIGLAYAGQLCPPLPMDANDQRLDGVLTEEGYRAASSG
jgi:5-formyltetrahydrofolate cyclo-ligase